jgi:RNA polymerase primary sigma factor
MKEIVTILQSDNSTAQDSVTLNALLAEYELIERQVILAHLPLVRRFSSRNVVAGEDPEDVFQEAYMGMNYAVRRFDPGRGYSFVSHSALWMQQVISRWRADKGSAIRIPVHRSANLNRLDKALERLGTAVTDSELAVELELSVNEVSVLRKIPRISEYLEIEEWEETLPPLEQSETITAIETQRIVAEALDILEEREAAIIKMRFGIGVDAEMTLEQIGQLIPLTRERVRQIEHKALMKLSHPMRKKNLKKLLGA